MNNCYQYIYGYDSGYIKPLIHYHMKMAQNIVTNDFIASPVTTSLLPFHELDNLKSEVINYLVHDAQTITTQLK